jgi:glyceraldehyde-3-phosphate dehydrogenase/erythrose-4-phosphate dehydrogenase
MEARPTPSHQVVEVVGEAVPTIVEDVEYSANIVVDATTTSSSTQKGRKHKTNATNRVVVFRTTCSKATKNGRNLCGTK